MHFTFIHRLSENNKPFEARIFIPRLTIQAKYTSSGVLIIIPASGGGEFHAVFGKYIDLRFSREFLNTKV